MGFSPSMPQFKLLGAPIDKAIGAIMYGLFPDHRPCLAPSSRRAALRRRLDCRPTVTLLLAHVLGLPESYMREITRSNSPNFASLAISTTNVQFAAR